MQFWYDGNIYIFFFSSKSTVKHDIRNCISYLIESSLVIWAAQLNVGSGGISSLPALLVGGDHVELLRGRRFRLHLRGLLGVSCRLRVRWIHGARTWPPFRYLLIDNYFIYRVAFNYFYNLASIYLNQCTIFLDMVVLLTSWLLIFDQKRWIFTKSYKITRIPSLKMPSKTRVTWRECKLSLLSKMALPLWPDLDAELCLTDPCLNLVPM